MDSFENLSQAKVILEHKQQEKEKLIQRQKVLDESLVECTKNNRERVNETQKQLKVVRDDYEGFKEYLRKYQQNEQNQVLLMSYLNIMMICNRLVKQRQG